jgi:hypothetical protein
MVDEDLGFELYFMPSKKSRCGRKISEQVRSIFTYYNIGMRILHYLIGGREPYFRCLLILKLLDEKTRKDSRS